MTPRRKKLIEDAEDAGYDVKTDRRNDMVTIARWNKRTGRATRGVVIYYDGTAIDLTVDLQVARGIKNYAEIRKLLGLKPDRI